MQASKEKIPGRRVVVDNDMGTAGMQPGDYGFWQSAGYWIAKTPNGEPANLSAHEITEHCDGTITVSPSIGIRRSNEGFTYHGYLTAGTWVSC